MGGELSDNLRMQVAQVNQTSGSMAQAQVATTVQGQSQTETSRSNPQTLTSKTNATAANPNGLEPYRHSVQPGENPNDVYTIQLYQ